MQYIIELLGIWGYFLSLTINESFRPRHGFDRDVQDLSENQASLGLGRADGRGAAEVISTHNGYGKVQPFDLGSSCTQRPRE